MKNLKFISWLLLLLPGFYHLKTYTAGGSTSPEVEKAVVQLVGGHNRVATGTGFFVEGGYLVATFQVMSRLLEFHKLEDISLIQKGNKALPVKIKDLVAVAPLSDLAILKTDFKGPFLVLREESLQESEDLFVGSYSDEGFKQLKKRGRIKDLEDGDDSFFFVDAYGSLEGVDGSPLLDSQQQVVGVIYESVGNFFVSTNGENLRDLIDGEMGLRCNRYKSPEMCLGESVGNLIRWAEWGSRTAQHKMGILFQEGVAVRERPGKAVRFFRMAAEQDYPPSLHKLAQFYIEYSEDSLVREEDKKQMLASAYSLYKRAAEQNYTLSQLSMAVMHTEGFGVVEKSEEEASHWCHQAFDFSKASSFMGTFISGCHRFSMG